MNFRLAPIFYLSIVIFLAFKSLAIAEQEIIVQNYDELWTADITAIPQDAFDSTNAELKLPNEAVICHADEKWTYKFEPLAEGVIDSSDATLKLPIEAIVCHSDEKWTDDLVNAEFDNNNEPVILSKTPVLFVPGLLSTRVYQNQAELWPNASRMVLDLSDSFLNSLQLNNEFIPVDNSLDFREVIRTEPTINYTDGLIKEFEVAGYNTSEGSADQTFYTFPYDWRYGVSGTYPIPENTSQRSLTNSDLLKAKIDQLAAISPTGKIDIVAHSMGGLILKKYIKDLGDDDALIGKLVFVGVPNLGAPQSAKALLMGDDFKIFGLNPTEIKTISQNMPAAYDLLPTSSYITVRKEGYIETITPLGRKKLNYNETNDYLKSVGLNSTAIDNAANLDASGLASFDARNKVEAVYNIAGCKSGTIESLIDYQADSGSHDYQTFNPRLFGISGDDTVPFESADSIITDNDKTFYLPLAEHGKMPSANGLRQTIRAIVAGGQIGTNIIPYLTLQNEPSLCQLKGDFIQIHSPLDIFVTEIDDNKHLRLGLDENDNIIREIPGADFEIINEHKYLYLPQGDGQQYQIDLQGTDNGTFTLIKQQIESNQTLTTKVFVDIPVSPEFSASLEITDNTTEIIPTQGDPIASFEIPGDSINDNIPPQTAVTINNQPIKQYYSDNVKLNLSAVDYAQEGIASAGVLSISYSLDGGEPNIINGDTASILIASEGNHTLDYFAKDKLGNTEQEKTISFAIDKTPTEIEFVFDQNKKDLVFSATDNISSADKIILTDQNGTVTATDEAGNSTKLTFKEKNRKQSLRAQLLSLFYNGKKINLGGGQLNFAWFYGYTPKIPRTLSGWQSLPAIPAKLPKTGSLSFLLQQVKLKDGSFVVALYANGKTTILELKNRKLVSKTFPGLKLLRFATNASQITWSY